MVPLPITDYLNSHRVPYTVYPHIYARTARRFAAQLDLPGYHAVHTVPFRYDGRRVLAVYDATASLDLGALIDVLGVRDLQPMMDAFDTFQGAEPAALPPFGRLFGAEVILDSELARHNDFILRGGTFEDAIEMKTLDYLVLEAPTIADIATPLERQIEAMSSHQLWTQQE